jgi:hypothetical protein
MTKYRVSRRVVVAQTTDGPLMDIVFDELTEQELLLALIKNPDLTYYAELPDGTVNFYSNGMLYAVNNQRVKT